VLAEKIGKEPMVVEVEFERIFGGWLRNGFAKPRAVYSRGRAPENWGLFFRRVAKDRSSFCVHF
jgi:hypothetical protein